MTLEDVPYRGVPQHATLTADTVEVVDLEADFPAVEVLAEDGRVTVTVDGDDPTVSSGHVVVLGSVIALRASNQSTGPDGVTRVKVLGAAGETPKIVVTGLR